MAELRFFCSPPPCGQNDALHSYDLPIQNFIAVVYRSMQNVLGVR